MRLIIMLNEVNLLEITCLFSVSDRLIDVVM